MLDLRLACAVPLLLAACSDRGAAPAAQNETSVAAETSATPMPAEPVAVATPSPSPSAAEVGDANSAATVGGDGSGIVLAPLRPDDAKGLDGELGCGFAERRGGPSLLVGRADVGSEARAFAVVRNGGVLERLASTATGGFGAMEKGPTFGGKGLTVRITPEGGNLVKGESVARRATLLVQRGDGAERRIQGLWHCGP